MPRPVIARIDLQALRHNLAVAREAAGSARILAIAKAAAYGHGLARVLPALSDADGLGLLDMGDAVAARQSGFRGRIVLLEGCFDEDDLREAGRREVDTVVHEDGQIRSIETTRLASRIGVIVKVNTGMNRLGFRPEQVARAVERLRAIPTVRDITLMTHFSCADDGRDVEVQADRFAAVAAAHRLPVTLANSAALLRHPQTRGDWVRPGIMLYGASPFADTTAAAIGLEPVMTLASRVIAVQSVDPGEAVGYGRQFVATGAMRIGVVACGYADGYPRHAPTGTPVLVDGVRTRTLGRVSMDMLYVDLTPCPAAGVGSETVLWGRGVAVDEVAAASGTVGYELLCALAPRVPVSVEAAGASSSAGDLPASS